MKELDETEKEIFCNACTTRRRAKTKHSFLEKRVGTPLPPNPDDKMTYSRAALVTTPNGRDKLFEKRNLAG